MKALDDSTDPWMVVRIIQTSEGVTEREVADDIECHEVEPVCHVGRLGLRGVFGQPFNGEGHVLEHNVLLFEQSSVTKCITNMPPLAPVALTWCHEETMVLLRTKEAGHLCEFGLARTVCIDLGPRNRSIDRECFRTYTDDGPVLTMQVPKVWEKPARDISLPIKGDG